MPSRRQFLEDASAAVGAILVPAPRLAGLGAEPGSRASAVGKVEFAWQGKPTAWSVNAGGSAPWAAQDLSISFEIDAQKYTFDRGAEASKEVAREPEIFGSGRATRYVLAKEGGRPTLRVVLSAYERPPRFLIHYEIENDTGKDIRLGEVRIEGSLGAPGWEGPLRVFVNSGTQGFSGSRPLEQSGSSAYLGMVIPTAGSSHLLAGFISYRRADAVLSFRRGVAGHVTFSGSIAYNQLRLPAGKTLWGEDLELLAQPHPHELVEGYADEVARLHKIEFNRDLTGMWNLWYAYWDPTSSQVGEKQILQGAKVLDETLGKYGIRDISTGVWQNRAAFGETEPWPGNFPQGIAGTAHAMRKLGYGLMNGVFMAKVSSCTEVFQRHPEWLIHDSSGQPIQRSRVSWGACHYPYYDLDITHPEAAAWYQDVAKQLVADGDVDYIGMDFEGTSYGGHYDDTVCAPFETDRRRIGIVRAALGPRGKIGTYTSPSNRYLGLTDRVRLGSDAGGINLSVPADKRWDFLMTCYRNMSAGYFYHGKFWWNDPDPGMPGDQELPETLEEGRCRLLYASLTGSFVTIGQRIPEVAPARLRLLKLGLPPMGKAAQPLDLFTADVATTYLWRLQSAWGNWHVLTLINWDPHTERKFNFQLSDLGIEGAHWVYELWTDKYLGQVNRMASFTIPSRASRVYALRPVQPHPWILATDLHLGMGYHELRQVTWQPNQRLLSAVVDRPADMPGRVMIVVPKGWRLTSDVPAAQVEGELIRLPVDFAQGPVNLALNFKPQG